MISLVLCPPADNISPRFYQQLLPVNATNEAAVTALPRAFAKAGWATRGVGITLLSQPGSYAQCVPWLLLVEKIAAAELMVASWPSGKGVGRG